MKLPGILLLFFLLGAMAKPEASELRSLQERSVDVPLHAPTALKLSDTFLGPELGRNVRHLLAIFGVHDINDLPRLFLGFSDGTAFKPIIKLLNSVSPTDIRTYLEANDPLQTFIKGIPIVGTMASYAGQLSNLPNTIIDSSVHLIMHLIEQMTKMLVGFS